MSTISAEFFFTNVSSPLNPKTNIAVVKSIRLGNDHITYGFPVEVQHIKNHEKLCRIPTVHSNVKAMTQRGQYRLLKIKMDEELQEIYVDDHGNAKFRECFLEAQDPKELAERTKTEAEINRSKPLVTLVKDMVLPKYSSKSKNAAVWIRSLNMECDRLGIMEGRRAEVMRIFMEKTPLEWFDAQWTAHYEDNWGRWTLNFMEAFGDKGWNEVFTASTWKWIPGTTYADYIIKKNSLLIDAIPDMSEKVRVYVTIVGLPREVRDKLEKSEMETLGKLLSEISKWEVSASESNSYRNRGSNRNEEGRRSERNEKRNSNERDRNGNKPKNPDYRPCRLCEKKGRRERYHHVNECWFNPSSSNYRPHLDKNKDKNTDKMIKVANNTEFQGLFDEMDSKN